MKLHQELKLKQPLASVNHEALLSLVRTSALMQKLSDRFFSRFGLTDVQFNILMILKEHGSAGLSQQELSEHLIVTKSNVVGLIDRLERSGYVKRCRILRQTFQSNCAHARGRKLELKIEESYSRVDKMMSALSNQQKAR